MAQRGHARTLICCAIICLNIDVTVSVILRGPSNTTAHVGDSVMLVCQTDSSHSEMIWERNNTVVSTDQGGVSIENSGQFFNLSINNVVVSDAGWYTCREVGDLATTKKKRKGAGESWRFEWSAQLVVHDSKDCSVDPCRNGATCVKLIAAYFCNCLPGFEGINCQTDTNECSSNPCENEATCEDHVGGYSCKCVPSTYGAHCETETESCDGDPLALIDGETFNIHDRALTASSSLYDETHRFWYSPGWSRLNKCPEEGRVCAWRSDERTPDEWIQADLQREFVIERVAIQGQGGNYSNYCPRWCNNWVKKFILQFSIDGNTWHEHDKVYDGNTDRHTVVTHDIVPTTARYVRLVVKAYEDYPTLRWELYGCVANPDACSSNPCENGAECVDKPDGYSCKCAPGYHGAICQLKADCKNDYTINPHNANCYHYSSPGTTMNYSEAGAFCTAHGGHLATVDTVQLLDWLTDTYKLTGEPDNIWVGLKEKTGRTLESGAAVYQWEDSLIYPWRTDDPDRGELWMEGAPNDKNARNQCAGLSWVSEIGGYRLDDTPCETQYQALFCEGSCDDEPLALIDGLTYNIPDSALSASSTHVALVLPNSRLNVCAADSKCAWAPSTGNVDEWIQADLLGEFIIRKVAVQSRGGTCPWCDYWVTEFKLNFSTDGSTWQDRDKIYNGPTSQHTIVTNDIEATTARYVRLVVKGYNKYPATRWEIYGCPKNLTACTSNPCKNAREKCEIHETGYVCKCAPGFQGTNCLLETGCIFHPHSAKCYYYSAGTKMSYSEANSFCSDHGGHLATVDTIELLDWLTDTFKLTREPGNIWVGLKEVAGETMESGKAVFQWEDGLNYPWKIDDPARGEVWQDGAPNDKNSRNYCSRLTWISNIGAYRLDDIMCGSRYPALFCEESTITTADPIVTTAQSSTTQATDPRLSGQATVTASHSTTCSGNTAIGQPWTLTCTFGGGFDRTDIVTLEFRRSSRAVLTYIESTKAVRGTESARVQSSDATSTTFVSITFTQLQSSDIATWSCAVIDGANNPIGHVAVTSPNCTTGVTTNDSRNDSITTVNTLQLGELTTAGSRHEGSTTVNTLHPPFIDTEHPVAPSFPEVTTTDSRIAGIMTVNTSHSRSIDIKQPVAPSGVGVTTQNNRNAGITTVDTLQLGVLTTADSRNADVTMVDPSHLDISTEDIGNAGGPTVDSQQLDVENAQADSDGDNSGVDIAVTVLSLGVAVMVLIFIGGLAYMIRKYKSSAPETGRQEAEETDDVPRYNQPYSKKATEQLD